MKMSISENKTGELWRNFMTRYKEIANSLTDNKISMQLYDPDYFDHFNPHFEFVKRATVEVPNYDQVPTGMETFTLPGGLYAVFEHKGSSTDHSIFQYIFTSWLPNSNYSIDHRPHFEILGEKYYSHRPWSEEEIWFPIKPKE